MRHYKKISLLLAFVVVCVTTTQAKIKVVERSSRSVPSWVNTTEKGYIITTAVASDIQRAQAICMENIGRDIVMSVAQNVETRSTERIEQHVINSEIESFLSSYSSTSHIEAAKVSYLTGVSKSKIEHYYWERRYDKAKGEVSYLYSVKYPFSSLELKKLVYAFNERDRKMNATLERLKHEFKSVNSIVATKSALSELRVLIDYFFDSVRKNEAFDLYQRYSAIYGLVSFKEIENNLGSYRFVYQYNGRDFAVTTPPTISSETLSNIVSHCDENGVWSVKYDYDTCDADEPNFADITVRLPDNKRVSQRFYADIKSDKLQIVPIDKIYLTGSKDSSGEIRSVEIRVTLKCQLKEPVTLSQLTLEIPGVSRPLFVDELRMRVTGTKEQRLTITYRGDVDIVKGQGGGLNMLKGSMSFYDSQSRMYTIKLSRPFICNW